MFLLGKYQKKKERKPLTRTAFLAMLDLEFIGVNLLQVLTS